MVVNDDAVGVLPLRVIVPLTNWKDRYQVARRGWCGLNRQRAMAWSKYPQTDTFQVRSLAQERFVRQLGRLTDEQMQVIAKALAVVLAIK